MKVIFDNAQSAFEYYYDEILAFGFNHVNTKMLENVGFYIKNPLDNKIKTSFRKWKEDYAESEWQWYLSGNPSVEDIKLKAKMWDKMHNGNNIVNSNYGFQWYRGGQLSYVIDELRRDKDSRRAVISIYDGKENSKYKYDTPCTQYILFTLRNNKLNMAVHMRSNDLWYGFCNDQYCFSKLQQMISFNLQAEIGTYYHFCNNLHLYEKQFNKKREYYYK
jgi:thymidylate synthase